MEDQGTKFSSSWDNYYVQDQYDSRKLCSAKCEIFLQETTVVTQIVPKLVGREKWLTRELHSNV